MDVCEARLFLSSSPSDTIRSLAEMTTALLKTFNVVDRVGIARRLLDEFDTNHALKQIIYDAEYVVKYPVKDVFLGYLGLAVNIKDSIRLLRCLNRPKRGLDSASFAALRHVAEKDNISAGQAAISFVGRRQLGASFYAPTASHPLYPWSSGLEHLVECLNKCQDALAGDSDDLVLTVVAQDDQMGLNDARKAVDSCLLAVGRFLRKPHRNALNSHEESADDPHFSEANIKQALGSLRSRLTQLTSCDCATSICGETPGRPLTSGGSLLGRAARKLARLLLVVEADASVVPIPSVSHEQPTTPSALLPKTPSRVPPVVTPLTVGHDEQVVRMFDSPCAPVNHTPTNRCLEEENMAPFAISADLDEAISMPERPVFSRYQTNLDWADCNCSPPPIKRVGTRKAGPNIDEIYACSMPSWTTEGNLCRAEAESDLYSP
ncbi:unnamed protein product [Echinostoma caproni]|uniref:PCNA-interacting partner n=1 Tax=Echinostoma caproni TaxID=27848 RepID=A0A3P8FZH5_9TREM|nr:unnamed protein product [Echinostoma caproni]